MGSPTIIINGEEVRPKEEKKEPRRVRRRGSGKNKKKIADEAVKKFKDDSAKKQKQFYYNLWMLGILGLPAGMIFWLLLNKLVHVVADLVAGWANYMASLLK